MSGNGPIRVPPLVPAKAAEYAGLFEKSGAVNGVLSGMSPDDLLAHLSNIYQVKMQRRHFRLRYPQACTKPPRDEGNSHLPQDVQTNQCPFHASSAASKTCHGNRVPLEGRLLEHQLHHLNRLAAIG